VTEYKVKPEAAATLHALGFRDGDYGVRLTEAEARAEIANVQGKMSTALEPVLGRDNSVDDDDLRAETERILEHAGVERTEAWRAWARTVALQKREENEEEQRRRWVEAAKRFTHALETETTWDGEDFALLKATFIEDMGDRMSVLDILMGTASSMDPSTSDRAHRRWRQALEVEMSLCAP